MNKLTAKDAISMLAAIVIVVVISLLVTGCTPAGYEGEVTGVDMAEELIELAPPWMIYLSLIIGLSIGTMNTFKAPAYRGFFDVVFESVGIALLVSLISLFVLILLTNATTLVLLVLVFVVAQYFIYKYDKEVSR